MRSSIKLFGIAAVVALMVVVIGGTVVFAQGPQDGGYGAGFVDADGDGVCDTCGGTGMPLRDGTGRHGGRGR